ncbi:MAG: N-formylglutamate amidohydrolase [Robiginitomaculum sp.]|nr:MAG: N-formylglutamate amidohydrolase [Robiginitomaculum sp.]
MNIWSTADPASRAARQKECEPGWLAEPAAVRVIAPTQITSPLVFAFPHSGRQYSASFLQQSRLDPLTLRSSEDAYVDQLFPASALPGASFVHAMFPRAWLDANRHPEALDPDMFIGSLGGSAGQRQSPQVLAGLGVIPKVVAQGKEIYAGKLRRGEINWRLSVAHTPYHQAVADALSRARDRFGVSVLVDCHSMPAICAAQTPAGPIDVVVGNRHGQSCDPMVSKVLGELLQAQDLRTASNVPYAGGYSVLQHSDSDRGAHAIQIELCRALYMDEQSIKKHEGFAQTQGRMITIMQRLDHAVRENLVSEPSGLAQ